MPTCGSCGKAIPEKQMQHGVLGDVAMPRTVPNLMEELAMRCNRCGEWICNECAVKTAQSAGAGAIQHQPCGGMFETP